MDLAALRVGEASAGIGDEGDPWGEVVMAPNPPRLAGVKWEEVALAFCCRDGEAGMGEDTILAVSCIVRPAASSAALALRFSANIADIAELAEGFFTAVRAAAAGSLDPDALCGLNFSSCFLAVASKLSMMVVPLADQMLLKDQKADRAASRTVGLTSAKPFLMPPSTVSNTVGVDSIAFRDRLPWISMKVLRCAVEYCRVCTFFSLIPAEMCATKIRG